MTTESAPLFPEATHDPLVAPVSDHAEGFLSELDAGWRVYGDAFSVSLGGLRAVVLSHPHDIRHVMTNANYRDKGPLYDGVRQIIGDGILTSTGQKWKDNHKLVAPAMHRNQIAGMVDTISATGMAYVQDLRMRAEGGTVIDMQEEMTSLTLDTLAAVLFGKQAEVVKALSYDDLKATFSLAGKAGRAVDDQLKLKVGRVTSQLDNVAGDMVADARKHEPEGTLLSMLAHTKDAETDKYLDDQTIRDELITIMFAGHETTALTLTWLFQLTQRHPEIRQRMSQEADIALVDGGLTATDVPRLTYVRQVIDETLRMRPPVPIMARVAQTPATLQGETIEAGDAVLPFIWGAHRHPEFWDAPGQFNPDRFAPEQIAARDRAAYVPFAAGGRICAGKLLALTELPIHTALIMRHVNLQTESLDVPPEVDMTLRPSRPVRAMVTPRP